MDEETLKMLLRIRRSSDGDDLLDFLRKKSVTNYNNWKRDRAENNDVYKGKALILDELVDLFETCESKLNSK